MRRLIVCGMLMLAAVAGSTRPAAAQTRADSAAVLLHTAEQLRLRGEAAAAHAVLDLIARQFGGTQAADEVSRMRALLRAAPEVERSGRTELMVFGASYGAWVGVALPLLLDADGPEAYGLGLLLGAPAGFIGAKAWADRHTPTEGQTRALTFGGLWGTYQGYGWAHVLDLGEGTETVCGFAPGDCQTYATEGDARDYVGAALLGGAAGIGTGMYLARKPISAGTAAAVTLSGPWGSWFGWGLAFLAGGDDEDGDRLLTAALIGGNVALLGTGMTAPRLQMTESRARLVSVGGVIGLLAGGGLLLIVQPDDEKVGVAFPLVGSAIGLGAAMHYTNNRAADSNAGGSGRGALLNLDSGRWALDMPQPAMRVERTSAGTAPAVYVPWVRARF